MKVNKLNKKGFTLIELLIVIIIIGILAAIAFVAYSGSQNKAHKADAQSTLAEVKNKLAEYNADHSSYPATIGDVTNWLNSSEGGNNQTMAGKFTGANGYTYTVTCGTSPCGDTVASGGAITQGSNPATGFTLVANASIWGDSNTSDNITVNN